MEKFGTKIHAILPSLPGIEFGALTPKTDHLTVNIAGKRVTSQCMKDFLFFLQSRGLLDSDLTFGEERFFKGKFPNSPAKRICGDRYIIIGDAAGLLRPFKGKGVTAACKSGICAAHTIMHCGISRGALSEFYRQMDEVVRDRAYGKVMRNVANFCARWRLTDSVLWLASTNENLRRMLFFSITGQRSFRRIVKEQLGSFKTIGLAISVVGRKFSMRKLRP